MIAINLPVGTIRSIIDIDNPKVDVSITDAYNFMNENEANYIRSMDTSYNLITKQNEKNKEYNIIEFDHNINFINKMKIQPILNNINVKFFKVLIRYWNDIQKESIFPGYVKLFSKTTKQFVPVEFISKSDMLVDYMGYNAQARSCEEIDFKPTEYYNILLSSTNNVQTNFYYDGILSYVCYINFVKDKENGKVSSDNQ